MSIAQKGPVDDFLELLLGLFDYLEPALACCLRTGLACLEENKTFPWKLNSIDWDRHITGIPLSLTIVFKLKSELPIRSLPTPLAGTHVLSLYFWPLFSIWFTTSGICLTGLLSQRSSTMCLYASILVFLSKSAALLSPSKLESLWYSRLWYLWIS